MESPFPRGICELCHTDFLSLKALFVRLNEGQALITDMLSETENIFVKSINFLADKKSLFRDKYPSMPKVVYHSASKPKVQEVSENTIDRSSKRIRKLPQR